MIQQCYSEEKLDPGHCWGLKGKKVFGGNFSILRFQNMFYFVISLGDGHWETIKISNAHTVSTFVFFSDGTVMNPAIWLVLNVVLIFLSLPMGNSNRWEWIILSVRSLTAFQENIVVTILAKLVPLLFLKCTYIFLSNALSNWQVSDCDSYSWKQCFKVCWKPYKSPLSLRKWKCFVEAFLFHLHHLYFNYHLLAQKVFSLWKILL